MICLGKGVSNMSRETFGSILRRLRLENGFGLRKFAKLVGILPSNLCHFESGKLNPPQNNETLERMAKVLNLKDGSPDWNKFFDLAAKPGEVAVDVKEYLCDQDMVAELPLMARAIKDKKMTKEDIERLIKDLKKI